MLRGVIRNTKLAANARKFSTVNKDEVEFFSRLSKHWWDESGEFGLLHKMNPARLEFILRNINSARTEDAIRNKTSEVEVPMDLRGMRALDIGCGGGLLSEAGALRC